VKRILAFGFICLALALVLSRCDLVNGGPPIEVGVATASDTTVTVFWSAPANGTPDAYLVYFMPVNEHSFAPVAETEDTSYVHKPHGVTGTYKVLAKFGSETFDSQDRPGTVPWFADTMSVGELNSGYKPGYGWSRSGPGAVTYQMDLVGNAYDVDFYITDMAVGSAGPVYKIASPDLGPADPGGTVQPAAWRVTGFYIPVIYENDPLPRFDEFTYLDQQDLTVLPLAIGVHTEDGHYGLVKVLDVDSAAGRVLLKSWLQPLAGLRLIKH